MMPKMNYALFASENKVIGTFDKTSECLQLIPVRLWKGDVFNHSWNYVCLSNYAHKPSLRLSLLYHLVIFVRLNYPSTHFLFAHVSVMSNVLPVMLHGSFSISVQIP